MSLVFFGGYCSMIEGLLKKIEDEQKEVFKIILTGGNAAILKELTKKLY